MNPAILAFIVMGLALLAFAAGRTRALRLAGGEIRRLHSLPNHYGANLLLWTFVPAALVLVGWLLVEPLIAREAMLAALSPETQNMSEGALALFTNDAVKLATGGVLSRDPTPEMEAAAAAYREVRSIGSVMMTLAVLAAAAGGFWFGLRRIRTNQRARNEVERAVLWLMIAASTIAILTTVGIVLSLIFETLRFFDKVPFTDFVFGLKWSPQIALRADQSASEGSFGMIPLLLGTLTITTVAMLVAVPVGLFAAIYMSDYAGRRIRAAVKPVLEILAGIPTVVYGFFAALTVAPFFRDLGAGAGLDVSSESALAAGIVMGIMIVPFVSSLSDDVMNAVPQALRDGSYAMGATKSETIRKVVLPAALPGIVGAVLLAVSRAIGETMIVVMAAGLAAKLSVNPLDSLTTITVQIVVLLIGDQEFDSAKTLAAFALGLMLFVVTLGLNIVALETVRRYRERYD